MKRAIALILSLAACDPVSGVKTAGFGGGSTGGSTSSGGVTAHSSLTGLTTGDDHTQYQKESEKSAANGYASLGAGGYVPAAELGSGASVTTKYLRGDNTWQTISSGSGDVVGPASSTDNAICRFDLATGKLIQNSSVLIDDSNNMSAIANLSNTGTTTFGDASGDTVTSNAATWTFASDTAVTLSGGVNGINFDANTLSVDATNNRVGIGTASPGSALTVESTATGTPGPIAWTYSGSKLFDVYTGGKHTYMTLNGVTSGGSNRDAGLYLYDSTDVNNTGFIAMGHSSGVSTTTDGGFIKVANNGTGVAGNLAFQMGATEYMTLLSTGSLGIGDTTPDALLDVAGTFQCDGNAVIGDAVASDTLTINALVKIASKTWASTDCDAAGEVGRVVMHDDGANHISLCACQQTGAATYAFSAMASGTCP